MIVEKENQIVLLKKLQYIVHFECIYISDEAKAFSTHNEKVPPGHSDSWNYSIDWELVIHLLILELLYLYFEVNKYSNTVDTVSFALYKYGTCRSHGTSTCTARTVIA